MLQTRNLTFSYPGSAELCFPDAQATPGQPLLVLGESGKGKTTLLHLLAGLLTPTSGSIQLAGQELSQLRGAKLDVFRGQHIGIVFQQAHFLAALTVRQNLEAASLLAKKPIDRDRADHLLESLGLASLARRKPASLSVGEQQRLAIARALMNKPALLLADEPSSALDNRNCESVIRLLRDAAAEAHSTLVIVTHDQRIKDQFDHHLLLN